VETNQERQERGVTLGVLLVCVVMLAWCLLLTVGAVWLYSVTIKPLVVWAVHQPYVIAGALVLAFLLIVGEKK